MKTIHETEGILPSSLYLYNLVTAPVPSKEFFSFRRNMNEKRNTREKKTLQGTVTPLMSFDREDQNSHATK